MTKSKQNKWSVYIVQCHDGTLYTGITNDLNRRIQQHNQGLASRYTRSRLPVQLVYQESFPDKSSALKREIQIKGYPKPEKMNLFQ